MEPLRPDQALAAAILRCTSGGTNWAVLNADGETVWEIEADSRVDDDDLTYPAIVHMRGGSYLGTDDEGIVVLVEMAQ